MPKRKKTVIDVLSSPIDILPPKPSDGRLPSLTRADACAAETTRLSLSSPHFVEMAAQILIDVLNGKLIGEATQIKTSDILRACEMIYDRFEPTHKQTEINIQIVTNTINVITQHLPTLLEQHLPKNTVNAILNQLADHLTPNTSINTVNSSPPLNND